MSRTSIYCRDFSLNFFLDSTFFSLRIVVAALAAFSSFRVMAQDTSATNHNYWAVEDAAARAKLPLYKYIPAAKTSELTPANNYPKPETFLSWHRSHGDNGGRR